MERIVGAQGRSHNLVESICRGMWATVLELTSLDGLCVSVVCLQILDTATRYAIDKPRPAVLVQVRFRQRSMAISEGFPYKLTLQTYADAMQRLVSFSCELLKNTPPVNEDGGCLIWGSEPVFCLCLNVGTLMAKAGKPRDAVNFLQSVKVRSGSYTNRAVRGNRITDVRES